MKLIQEKAIEAASTRLSEADEDQLQKIMDVFSEQQPYLLEYLLSVDGDVLNEDEQETVLFLGIIVWLAFQNEGQQISLVQNETLDKIELQNEQMIDFLAEEDEDAISASLSMILDNHPQPYLLGFIINSCLAEEDEELNENNMIMFIDLKIFLECLQEHCIKEN